MIAYAFDRSGFYLGEVKCQPSPLEPGKFLIPGGATPLNPPSVSVGEEPRFNGFAWEIVESRESIEAKAREAERIKREKEEAEAAQAAEELRVKQEAKKAIKDRLSALDFSKVTTVAQVKAVVVDLTELIAKLD